MTSDKADRLAAVRVKFIASVKERAQELTVCLAEEHWIDEWQSLQAKVHKIAGSAGFYGEHDVACLAAAIDRKLQVEPNTDAIEDLRAEISALIETIQAL